MTPLDRYLAVLSRVVPYLPAQHALQVVFMAARVLGGKDVRVIGGGAAEDHARKIRRLSSRMAASNIGAISSTWEPAEEVTTKQRFRLAQLLLGQLTEERFGREREELAAGRLSVEDHRRGRTDTDFRVMNGGGRPIFRINIKFHGSVFQQARVHVGLEPNDCFALATYKIHQATVRQREEALPYVFVVLSALGLTAQSVAEVIPAELAWFVTASARFGKRDVEEAVVAYLLTDEFQTSLAGTRRRISDSEFRVISASRAEKLLKEKLFDRVFALRRRGFTSAFRNAEVDMHFSLTAEMVPVREFLRMVAAESPQRLAVLLYNGDTV